MTSKAFEVATPHLLPFNRVGAGVPLVLVHGYLGGSSQWDAQVLLLKEHFEIVTLDLAGYGKANHLAAPTDLPDHARNEKWRRLFEQHSPIYKWTAGGLLTVQSCPRRRASLATNARRGGQLGAHQRSSSYAASLCCGKPAKYASSGVSRSKLEWARCALYQAR